MDNKQVNNKSNNPNITIDSIPTQWKPGQSGNPNGRPKDKTSITYWYRKLLEDNEGISAKMIAQEGIRRAGIGSLPHAIEITDRTDGKVVDKHLAVVVNTTPELLEEAQKRLTGALSDTRELLDEHKGG